MAKCDHCLHPILRRGEDSGTDRCCLCGEKSITRVLNAATSIRAVAQPAQPDFNWAQNIVLGNGAMLRPGRDVRWVTWDPVPLGEDNNG